MGDNPGNVIEHFIQIMNYLLLTERLPDNLNKLFEYVETLKEAA